MQPIGMLLLACLISLLGYFLLFGLVVSRPLTVDVIQPILDSKLDYARRAHGPKVWILAGSNARFSHSCAILEKELRRPCVNLGIAGGVRLDWVTGKSEPLMRPGDLVYMPLEYQSYTCTRADYLASQDAAYMFRHERLRLWDRGIEGVVRAAFMFDLQALVNSIGEMGLSADGVSRRYGVATLDAQGDETGNSDDKAVAYEAAIDAARFRAPSAAEFSANPRGCQMFAAMFLDWAREHRVTIVGGLPTTFADVPIDPGLIANIGNFYASHGAALVVLPDASRFPRRAFFDTPYHLRSSAQERHSRQLANALRPYLEAVR